MDDPRPATDPPTGDRAAFAAEPFEAAVLQVAEAFRSALQPVWEVSGAGQAWILHEAEAATY